MTDIFQLKSEIDQKVDRIKYHDETLTKDQLIEFLENVSNSLGDEWSIHDDCFTEDQVNDRAWDLEKELADERDTYMEQVSELQIEVNELKERLKALKLTPVS